MSGVWVSAGGVAICEEPTVTVDEFERDAARRADALRQRAALLFPPRLALLVPRLPGESDEAYAARSAAEFAANREEYMAIERKRKREQERDRRRARSRARNRATGARAAAMAEADARILREAEEAARIMREEPGISGREVARRLGFGGKRRVRVMRVAREMVEER